MPHRITTEKGAITIDWGEGDEPLTTTYKADWLRARDLDLARIDRHGYHLIGNKHWGNDNVKVGY